MFYTKMYGNASSTVLTDKFNAILLLLKKRFNVDYYQIRKKFKDTRKCK